MLLKSADGQPGRVMGAKIPLGGESMAFSTECLETFRDGRTVLGLVSIS